MANFVEEFMKTLGPEVTKQVASNLGDDRNKYASSTDATCSSNPGRRVGRDAIKELLAAVVAAAEKGVRSLPEY